jgi:hypothetical protein
MSYGDGKQGEQAYFLMWLAKKSQSRGAALLVVAQKKYFALDLIENYQQHEKIFSARLTGSRFILGWEQQDKWSEDVVGKAL